MSVASADVHTERTPLLLDNEPSIASKPAHPICEYSQISVGTHGHAEDGHAGGEIELYVPGKSTFIQTLLNCLGDMVGTGILALPIAIAHLGWILGPGLLVVVGLFQLYTLKLMIRIIETDRRVRGFNEVIARGVPGWACAGITWFFACDVAIFLIAIIVLFSDTLAVLWPVYTSDEWKVIGLGGVVLTCFFPIRHMAWASFVGIISCWSLVILLLLSGVIVPHAPGSLRDSSPTDLEPPHGYAKGVIAFSVILACFGGHGMVPNLVRDMADPSRADLAVEITFAMVLVIYLAVGAGGYLMYGRDVTDEISRDLARTPGAPRVLSRLAVWMVAICPLSKIPLVLCPLSDIICSYFKLHPTVVLHPSPHLHASLHSSVHNFDSASSSSSSAHHRAGSPLSVSFSSPPDHHAQVSTLPSSAHAQRERIKAALRPPIRIALACLGTAGALVLPRYEAVLAIHGGVFGIILGVLLPVWVAGGVLGWKSWYTPVVVAGCAFAVVGGWAAVVGVRAA